MIQKAKFFLSLFNSLTCLVTLLILFLSFQHPDLIHTAVSSYAFNLGHFSDFYEYNKFYLSGNDYLPLIYMIFSIWNIPLSYFNLAVTPENDFFSWYSLILPSSILEIAWWKFLIVLIYSFSVILIYKIANLMSRNNELSLFVARIFATSPLVIFSVFIFGSYDIFCVFFTLLGIFYLMKENSKLFLFFSSVAASFKYFSILIALPLLLSKEKNIKKALLSIFCIFLICFFQFFIFFDSEVFKAEIFTLLFNKIEVHQGSFKGSLKLLAGFFYVFYLFSLFTKKKFHRDVFFKFIIFTPIFLYAVMFLLVVWHPQWIVIICPFMALSYIYIKNRRSLIFLDILGSLSFFVYILNRWKGNVDVSMINFSILRDFLPSPKIFNAQIFPVKPSFFRIFFNLYLFFPLIIFYYEYHEKISNFTSQISKNLVTLRMMLGLSFFIVSSLICIFT